MSVRLMAAVWQAVMPPLEKLVALSIADNANDTGHCWPSINHLVQKTGLSERCVQEKINALTESGWLTRQVRAGKSSVFVIQPPHGAHPARDAPPQVVHPTPAGCAPPPPHAVHPEPSREPPKKSPKRPPGYSPEFERWYEPYPRKDGSKAEAAKAYQRAVQDGASPETLAQGLERFVGHCRAAKTEQRYIAHPATWLNQRRWEAAYAAPKAQQQYSNRGTL